MHPSRYVALAPSFVVVSGSLGWHVTWAVLFDMVQNRVIAYETFGAQGDIVGAYARTKIPQNLRTAIVACGAEWGGVWQYDWPDDDPKAVPPAPDPAKPIWAYPIDDLLPPQR